MTKFSKKQVSWLSNQTLSINYLNRRFCESKAVIFFITLILFASCKKGDDKLGLGVVPDNQKIGTHTTDTFTIHARTVPVDSVFSKNGLVNLLGANTDAAFGRTKAGVYFQYKPSTNSVDFGDLNTLEIDSVVLSLVYSDIYGKPGTQQIDVYTVEEDIDASADYYSNLELQTGLSNKAIQAEYTIEFKRTELEEGEEPEQLRLKLNPTFGEDLIRFTSTTIDDTLFIAEYKGLYVKPNDFFASQISIGDGAIASFDMLNAFTKLTVFYKTEGEASSYDYIIDNQVARINTFKHDYSGFEVEAAINNEESNRYYLQPMSGFNTVFEVPTLTNLIDSVPVFINKAELVASWDFSDIGNYSTSTQLYVEAKTETGNYTPVADIILEDLEHFDGKINTEEQYVFNLTRDVQFALREHEKGNEANLGYRITSPSSAITAPRTVIYGTDQGEKSLKLIVSYTPLN